MKVLKSKYYKVNTPLGRLHVHIDYDDDYNIEEIFLRIAPLGTEISNLTAMLGVFLSESIKLGLDINKAVKHLNTSKSYKRVITDNMEIETIEQAVGLCLKDFIENIGRKNGK